MKSLAYLAVPILLLSSCGDDAPSDIQDSVRARLPLYYEINDVKAETSKQNVFGKEVNVSQLAVDVSLGEDLYINSRLSEEFQKQLDETRPSGGFSFNNSINKTFIKKVATKGDSKTVYGELVTSDLADGKTEIQNFKIKDANGKPMSAFNPSEVIIVGSPEEKSYVDEILLKRTEAIKMKEAEVAKKAEDKRLKEEAEKARVAAIAKEQANALAEQKEQIIQTFAEGKTYEGAYLLKTGEEVTVTVSKFDAQFLHGTLEVKKKDGSFKTDVKFAFQLSKARSNQLQYYILSGQNVETGKLDQEVTKSSALANNARFRYLRLNAFKFADDSITLNFGNYGKLMLKK